VNTARVHLAQVEDYLKHDLGGVEGTVPAEPRVRYWTGVLGVFRIRGGWHPGDRQRVVSCRSLPVSESGASESRAGAHDGRDYGGGETQPWPALRSGSSPCTSLMTC